MPKRSKPTVAQRLGEADPILSMGQRVWDWLSYFWGPITISGLWGAAVTVAAYLSVWWIWLGPLGITLLAFFTSTISWIAIAAASNLRASKRKKSSEADVFERFQPRSDQINPLLSDFHNQRVLISDMRHPLTGQIQGKKFTSCQILGPANITIGDNSNISHCKFRNCDLVATKRTLFQTNSMFFVESEFLSCEIINCTIFVHPDVVPSFEDQKPYYISITGVEEIDNRFPQGIESKK